MLEKQISDTLLDKVIAAAGGCDLKEGPWIAGGAARKLWVGEPWTTGDVDFWFKDAEQFAAAKDRLHVLVSGSVLYDHRDQLYQAEKASNKAIHQTANAVTYRVLLSRLSTEDIVRTQIIKTRWFDGIDDIFGHFDFTACKFATDGRTIVATPDAVEHALARRLVSNPSLDPNQPRRVCPKRVIKYGLYGFEAEPGIMRHLINSRNAEGFIEVSNGQDGNDDDDGY